MATMYANLWTHVIVGATIEAPNWHMIATAGLHAIYPKKLDGYWKNCCDDSSTAGALVLRYNSAAAGTALWRALYFAATDVLTVFPTLAKGVQAEYAKCKEVTDTLSDQDNRWVGSINRKYYNAGALPAREDEMAPLASLVRGVYQGLAEHAAFMGSKAAERVAKSAPLMQALMSKFSRLVANSEQYAYHAMVAVENP